ncbi:MAG: hypothetical protein PHX51_03255 [Clostridia bacterium]|nr:hypothetical protein [Clostridia bacterium]
MEKDKDISVDNQGATTLREMTNTTWRLDERDILLDKKFIMKEYYAATFVEDGTALKISFNNGQSFLISVRQVKDNSLSKL